MLHTVDYSREKDRPQIRPHPCPKSPHRHIRRRACRAHPSHYQIICYKRHIKHHEGTKNTKLLSDSRTQFGHIS